jgi:CheY-like chemotaxis protein
MNIEAITKEIFHNAINSYLKYSYPNGIKTTNFCYENYKKFIDAKTDKEILNLFDKVITSEGKDESNSRTRYELRLGSEKYPFMKLVLQESFKNNEFGFLIDRHSEYLALYSSSKSYKEENLIKEYTRNLKYKIENEFIKNKLPTYREIVKGINKNLNKIKSSSDIKNNGINILLIEDDQDILELSRLNLEISGFNVTTAENGLEALNKISDGKYDVMVLDLMIPNISGFEILERLNKDIPIIVLTSLLDESSKNKCLTTGAKVVLTKPVDFEKLDKTIKNILNK